MNLYVVLSSYLSHQFGVIQPCMTFQLFSKSKVTEIPIKTSQSSFYFQDVNCVDIAN